MKIKMKNRSLRYNINRLRWRRGVVIITTAQLHLSKSALRFCAGINPEWWCWGSLIVAPAGNKAKRLSSVSHITKTTHHHHHHHHHHHQHGHKNSKYKMSLIVSVTMLLCIKQRLSNIWSLIHEKVEQHWGWVQKKCCFI